MLRLTKAATAKKILIYLFILGGGCGVVCVRKRKATNTQPPKTDNVVTLGMSLTTHIKRQAVVMKKELKAVYLKLSTYLTHFFYPVSHLVNRILQGNSVN